MCQRERDGECVHVCMCVTAHAHACVMTVRGASTGSKPTSVSVKNMRSGMEKNVHYVPNTKFRIFYCFFPEEVGERELEKGRKMRERERSRDKIEKTR